MTVNELVTHTIDHILTGKTSLDIAELLGQLPDDVEKAASAFCKRFDLGEWFFEAMQLNDISIVGILENIKDVRMEIENDDMWERTERNKEYQSAVWPD